MKEQDEDGHDDHAAAQAGERPEQPGESRHKQHRAGEFDQTHLDCVISLGGDDKFFVNGPVEHQPIDVHHLRVVLLPQYIWSHIPAGPGLASRLCQQGAQPTIAPLPPSPLAGRPQSASPYGDGRQWTTSFPGCLQ